MAVTLFDDTGVLLIDVRIRDLPWAELHEQLTITVSLGVAAAADVSDVTELLARADHHLYRAEHRGKDRVHG